MGCRHFYRPIDSFTRQCTICGDIKDKPGTYQVYVPVTQGRALLNAVGSSSKEAQVNVDLLDLTDEELQDLTIQKGMLTLD